MGMAIKLMEHDLTIVYHRGGDNAKADGLSSKRGHLMSEM